MGSRLRPRDQIKHIFECFVEVSAPKPGEDARIVQRFPRSFAHDDTLKSIPHFAFPCGIGSSTDVIQHFSFVLTSIDSQWTFGFCRLPPSPASALVLLSSLPWHEIFYRVLNQLWELQQKGLSQLEDFLDSLFSGPVPELGGSLTVPLEDGVRMFVAPCPPTLPLPSVPENRNLAEYVSALEPLRMLQVLAALLFERRVVIVSSRLSRLSACVQACNALLFPMYWQHIFIPVLPAPLADYLLAPMPYLVGVPEKTWKQLKLREVGDVVLIDADRNQVTSPFTDEDYLPQDATASFLRRLKAPDGMVRDGVPRACLRLLVHLIGGYREALRFHEGASITFDAEAFVSTRPPSLHPLLRSMLHLQIFQQFIEERLTMLNEGRGFSDEFELEAYRHSEREGQKIKQQYLSWMNSVRREGGAFLKNVKSKANPAMKSAVKNVRDRGRSAYRDFRTKWKGHRDDTHTTQLSSRRYNLEPPLTLPNLPRSAPASPTPTSPLRPMSLGPWGSTTSYTPLTLSSPTNEVMAPLDLDLLGDLEHVIYNNNNLYDKTKSGNPSDDSTPPVPNRHLKPSRSLEGPLATIKGKAPTPPPRPKRRDSSNLIQLETTDPLLELDPLYASKTVSPSESQLLLDYGLDFSGLKLGSNQSSLPPDPFSPLEKQPPQTTKLRPTWTTFD